VGFLDLFRAKTGASPREKKREHQLFDDEFQRKLEMLALVSRRMSISASESYWFGCTRKRRI
jgi:hypothetical protein